MPDINSKREFISDEDPGNVAEELLERYDFQLELEDEEVFAQDASESLIVDNYDNYINLAQLEADAEAMNISSYLPAQVLRVLTKTARTLPSGQVVLDYVLEIQGVEGADSYEVRALQI
jgi:hypothetical protein